MNIIERIEKQVEAGGTSAYFHIRSDDVRALLRLAKAAMKMDDYITNEHDHAEYAAALAALEAPCE